MNVPNVVKPIVIGHPLFNIRGSILERNSLNLMNVGKLSNGMHTLSTPENSYWREILYMQKMWQVFQQKYTPQSTPENSY